jgi:hypothetical protein
MWKAMRIAKRNADMMYKMKAMSNFIEPMMGTAVKSKAVEEVHLLLHSVWCDAGGLWKLLLRFETYYVALYYDHG